MQVVSAFTCIHDLKIIGMATKRLKISTSFSLFRGLGGTLTH
jgi:hypothetical protein